MKQPTVLPFWLLLVLKVCGRLWDRAGPSPVHRLPLLEERLARRPGMKEGCSGENVLERER